MSMRVKSVDPGSPAQKAGIQPGTLLLSVDGNQLNDALDYQYYTASPSFQLAATIEGRLRYLDIQKDQYTPFGCDFDSYLGDEKHSCSNHCIFCFIDQLPPCARENLWFKDDDARLSFLFGNYITLTNMSQEEVDRIIRMRISPLNISVHTTDPQLRVRMMANKRAGEVLAYLDQFAQAGITMNFQLVLCRGINDGDNLRRTLEDLQKYYPHVESIAAVPAGVTAHRKGLYPLEPYDPGTAAQTLEILEEYGRRCLQELGTRLIYPGDEWYLLAGRTIPDYDFYEDFSQLENGVGMWRLYREEFLEELARPHGLVLPRKLDVVTGTLAAPLIQEMIQAVQHRYPQVRISVHPVKNNFFGGNVNVAGLVCGGDIMDQCRGKLTSRTLCVPEVMVRTEGDMFLDDTTVTQLAKELKVKVQLIPVSGAENCLALLGKPIPKDNTL